MSYVILHVLLKPGSYPWETECIHNSPVLRSCLLALETAMRSDDFGPKTCGVSKA